MNHRAFLRALAATVAGTAVCRPAAEAIGRSASGQIPARVGETEVAQLNDAIGVFADWQDLYGGGVCHDTINGHVFVGDPAVGQSGHRGD